MILKKDRYVLSGGVDMLSLSQKYGCPLYVYDHATIVSQFNRMRKAFKVKKLKINYACKALSNINILKAFKELGAGLDTVSIQEVILGLKAGFDPKDIIYTPNCVGLDEIEKAVKHGVRINIDNLSILEQFGQIHDSIGFHENAVKSIALIVGHDGIIGISTGDDGFDVRVKSP